MVFTLNTTVFAEEVAVDSVDDAVEATVDAVDEVAEEAAVDAVDETTAATSDVKEVQGIKYTENAETGVKTAVTKISFASNGDKKKPVYNVCTIKDTTDPLSWNGVYAANLIETVLSGKDGEDEYLNNSSKVTVSADDPTNELADVTGLEKLKNSKGNHVYKVIPVVDGSQYIFVGYGLNDGDLEYVAGYDDSVKTFADYTAPATIPVDEWDGRQIDFNKSGIHKYTTGKKEALDVAVAFVTYANGTVTEVNGVNAGTVKVDKKAQKAASVEYDVNPVSKTYTGYDIKEPTKSGSRSITIPEHKTMGDLPYFTIKPGVKGNDAKEYKKDITAKLKDQKFYFGIMQMAVPVTFGTIGSEYAKQSTVSESTISGDQLKDAEEAIAKSLTNKASFMDDVDKEEITLGSLKVTKFTDKGATVTLRGWVGDDKNGWGDSMKDLKALSGKGKNAEYSLESGTVAGTSVSWLKFAEGGNFVYEPLTLVIKNTVEDDKDKATSERVFRGNTTITINENDVTEFFVSPWSSPAYNETTGVYTFTTNNDLAPAGFKWAFRKSPEEKSKKFRYGVYKADGQGFVYSVDETAVDSVEEAF